MHCGSKDVAILMQVHYILRYRAARHRYGTEPPGTVKVPSLSANYGAELIGTVMVPSLSEPLQYRATHHRYGMSRSELLRYRAVDM